MMITPRAFGVFCCIFYIKKSFFRSLDSNPPPRDLLCEGTASFITMNHYSAFPCDKLKALYIIITPAAGQIAFLNILNFLGSMQHGCLLGAQIAIILTISFTVLYAGYPYKIPGWGQKNLSCRGQGSNSGLFALKSSVLTSTPQVLLIVYG